MNLKAFSKRINELLAIKTPMIWVVTREEAIAEKAVVKEAVRGNVASHFYYCDSNDGSLMDPITLKPSTAKNASDGISAFENEMGSEEFNYSAEVHGLMPCLSLLSRAPESVCLVIRNAEEIWQQPNAQRAIFNICMRGNHPDNVYSPIIMITPEKSVPDMLKDFTESIELPLMDEKENLMLIAPWAMKHNVPLTKQEAFHVARCATGLTTTQVMHALEDGVHQTGKVDADIINETRTQVIKQSNVLTYVEPKKTLDDIGGHEFLKDWIREVKACMTPEALAAHVKPSKGFIASGIAGTGKTAIAEAIAHEMGVPFIIFDLSKIMGGIVGQSEQTTRRAFEIIKAIGACVVLIDEADKQFAAVDGSSPVNDGGTIKRVFDVVLQSMQNNASQFYILTANDISKLPSPLMRSGRLDRKWYFSFPSEEERKDIFNIYFKQADKEVESTVVDYAARMADHFTGAEIETAVNNMVRISFLRKTDITNAVALRGINEVSSVWKNNREEVDKLFEYAQKNGIPSTSSSGKKKTIMDEEAKRRCAIFDNALENFDAAEGV